MADYPISQLAGADNLMLRRILYALTNNGAQGLAPEQSSNTLLRQILYAIQNQAGGGGSSYVLPVATSTVLGGVKQGSGVTIDSGGVLSVPATTSVTMAGDVTGNSAANTVTKITGATPGSTTAQASLANLGAENSSVVAQAASFAVVQADAGKMFNITTGSSAIVVTLPSAATLPSGWTVYARKADSGTGTVANDAGTFMIGSAGHTVKITSDGSAFIYRAFYGAFDGSGNLTITIPSGKNTTLGPGNVLLTGTANTAANQVGTTPAASTLLVNDQAMVNFLARLHPAPPWSLWTPTSVSGTATTSNNIVNTATSSTTTSSGLVYMSSLNGFFNTYGVSANRTCDFSKRIGFSVTFFGNGISAAPNTVYRVCLGKINNSPPALGAPSVRALSFKLVFDTVNVGHLYAEVHNGTSLTTSALLASLDLSGSQIIHQIIVRSDGTGTVTYYLNGALVGTITGGPSTTSATANSNTLTIENNNTGDAVAAGSMFTCEMKSVFEN